MMNEQWLKEAETLAEAYGVDCAYMKAREESPAAVRSLAALIAHLRQAVAPQMSTSTGETSATGDDIGGMPASVGVAGVKMADTKPVAYSFPLRQNYVAQLVVPRDLTLSEATRLCAFICSLAPPAGVLAVAEPDKKGGA